MLLLSAIVFIALLLCDATYAIPLQCGTTSYVDRIIFAQSYCGFPTFIWGYGVDETMTLNLTLATPTNGNFTISSVRHDLEMGFRWTANGAGLQYFRPDFGGWITPPSGPLTPINTTLTLEYQGYTRMLNMYVNSLLVSTTLPIFNVGFLVMTITAWTPTPSDFTMPSKLQHYTYPAQPRSLGLEYGGSLPDWALQSSAWTVVNPTQNAFYPPFAGRLHRTVTNAQLDNSLGGAVLYPIYTANDNLQVTFPRLTYITGVVFQSVITGSAYAPSPNYYMWSTFPTFNLSVSTTALPTDMLPPPNALKENSNDASFTQVGTNVPGWSYTDTELKPFLFTATADYLPAAYLTGAAPEKVWTLPAPVAATAVRFSPVSCGRVNLGAQEFNKDKCVLRLNYIGYPDYALLPPYTLGIGVGTYAGPFIIPDSYMQASSCPYCPFGLYLPYYARMGRYSSNNFTFSGSAYIGTVGDFLQLTLPKVPASKAAIPLAIAGVKMQSMTNSGFTYYTSLFSISYSTTFTPDKLTTGSVLADTTDTSFTPLTDSLGNVIAFRNLYPPTYNSTTCSVYVSENCDSTPFSFLFPQSIMATAIRITMLECVGPCILRVDLLVVNVTDPLPIADWQKSYSAPIQTPLPTTPVPTTPPPTTPVPTTTPPPTTAAPTTTNITADVNATLALPPSSSNSQLIAGIDNWYLTAGGFALIVIGFLLSLMVLCVRQGGVAAAIEELKQKITSTASETAALVQTTRENMSEAAQNAINAVRAVATDDSEL